MLCTSATGQLFNFHYYAQVLLDSCLIFMEESVVKLIVESVNEIWRFWLGLCLMERIPLLNVDRENSDGHLTGL